MESVDIIFTGRVLPGADASRVSEEVSRVTGVSIGVDVLTAGQDRLAMQGLTPEHARAWLSRLNEMGVDARFRESSVSPDKSFGPPARAVSPSPLPPVLNPLSESAPPAQPAHGDRRLFWGVGVASVLFLVGLVVASLLPRTLPATHKNSIGMEFVLIPAGSFQMGCSSEAEACDDDEKPRHQVTISQPFYLGKYEVTQAQWQAIMNDNPSHFKGADRPVEMVSWEDVQTFIRRLNEKEGRGRNVYRLPTEAEWEYAARAGSATAYSFGDDAGQLGKYAWYKDNSGEATHAVGQKQPNAWGLYDMHGNVWEWTQDRKGAYSAGAVVDPQEPQAGEDRVLRGGSWLNDARYCRSAGRIGGRPALRDSYGGFRLVRSSGH